MCAICTGGRTGFAVTPIGANGFSRCVRSALRQIEGSRLRSVARLSSGAECRPSRQGRNRDGVSCGNCTRSQFYVTVCTKCGYDTPRGGWPEMGREDEALCALVANWHGLTHSERSRLMERLLTRPGGRLGDFSPTPGSRKIRRLHASSRRDALPGIDPGPVP